MRLRNLYGVHRLAMLGVALLVLSVAVFALTAALAHLRSNEDTRGAARLRLGPSGGGPPAESPWHVDEGDWVVEQTDYAAGPGQASLVADSPGADIRLSFWVTAGSPPALPAVVIREREAGTGYILTATSDGRLSLARSADGKPHVVAKSAVLRSTGDTKLDFELEASGPRLRAWLNGVLAIDYTDREPMPDGRVRIRTQEGSLHLSQLSLTPLAD